VREREDPRVQKGKGGRGGGAQREGKKESKAQLGKKPIGGKSVFTNKGGGWEAQDKGHGTLQQTNKPHQ